MPKRKPSTSAADKQLEETKLIQDLIVKDTLFEIFEDAWASNRIMYPDDAVKELSSRISELLAKVNSAPNWLLAIRNVKLSLYPAETLRSAHHLAVDLFYDHRSPNSKRMGAPSLPYFHLVRLLRLEAEGLSHLEIAKKLEWPMATPEERERSIDRLKKQLRVARKRLPLISLSKANARGK